VEVDDEDIIAIGTTPSAITAEGKSLGRQES
jgi:hypothetical protein